MGGHRSDGTAHLRVATQDFSSWPQAMGPLTQSKNRLSPWSLRFAFMASAFRKIRSSRKTSPLCWGADIFRQALELPSVQTLYLSWVMTAVEGNTYFPPISEEWQPIRWEVFNKGPGVPIPFIFVVYHR